MDTVEVSTEVHLPPEEVYEFLLDFPRYARYSEHLTDVRQFGDGAPDTEYELDFEWWKLSYTRVRMVVEYAPDSAEADALDLPRFVSLEWVVEKVKPKVRAEAERVVRRIVADLEGQRRDVSLDIETY
ncbi:polyketide cyclase [Halobacteriales archaeon QS_9_70_65]|nr:MAG: polyketide cyclase [Halobacteriales archaeon QS_9_70_65]